MEKMWTQAVLTASSIRSIFKIDDFSTVKETITLYSIVTYYKSLN
jgi:hypothetical protein